MEGSGYVYKKEDPQPTQPACLPDPQPTPTHARTTQEWAADLQVVFAISSATPGGPRPPHPRLAQHHMEVCVGET